MKNSLLGFRLLPLLLPLSVNSLFGFTVGDLNPLIGPVGSEIEI